MNVKPIDSCLFGESFSGRHRYVSSPCECHRGQDDTDYLYAINLGRT